MLVSNHYKTEPFKKCCWVLLYVGHLLLGMKPRLQSDLPTQWDYVVKQNKTTKFLSFGDSFWIGNVGLCLLLSALGPLQAQTCTGPMNAATTFVSSCTHLSCLCLNGFVSLVFNIPSDSYNLTISSAGFSVPWDRGFDGDTPFRTESPKVSHSLHLDFGSLFTDSCPLQGGASLMRYD